MLDFESRFSQSKDLKKIKINKVVKIACFPDGEIHAYNSYDQIEPTKFSFVIWNSNLWRMRRWLKELGFLRKNWMISSVYCDTWVQKRRIFIKIYSKTRLSSWKKTTKNKACIYHVVWFLRLLEMAKKKHFYSTFTRVNFTNLQLNYFTSPCWILSRLSVIV